MEGKTITITTNHKASKFGMPVIVVNGKAVAEQHEAEALREICERLGWTQSQLAERSGKGFSTAKKYCQGSRKIPAETLNMLAEAIAEKKDNE